MPCVCYKVFVVYFTECVECLVQDPCNMCYRVNRGSLIRFRGVCYRVQRVSIGCLLLVRGHTDRPCVLPGSLCLPQWKIQLQAAVHHLGQDSTRACSWIKKKIRIRETPTLSACADSSTNTMKSCLFLFTLICTFGQFIAICLHFLALFMTFLALFVNKNHVSQVTCLNMSHVTCHMSHVTYHMSPSTCH